MKKVLTIGFLFFITVKGIAQINNQRILSEGKIVYSIELLALEGSEKGKEPAALKGASQTVWIKGNSVRVDFNSSLRKQTLFYNGAEKTGVVWKKSGKEQYLTPLNAEQWLQYFDAVDSSAFVLIDEVQDISGLICKKALIQRRDTIAMTLFYTSQYIPFTKGYNPIFSNINGLPVQYIYMTNGYQVTFTLKTLENVPVAASLFEEPTSGFKLLEYKNPRKTGNQK
jgi:hypothetical protein